MRVQNLTHHSARQERETDEQGNSHVMSPGRVGLAPKWVRLDPNFDKSGTFSDQISVHLAHRAKCTEI